MSILSGGYLSFSVGQVSVFGSVDGDMCYSRPGHTRQSPDLVIDTRKLNAAIHLLSGAISQWIVASTDWEYRGDDEREPALQALRSAGIAAFKALEGDKPGVLRYYLADVTYLESRVRREHIPWEFLYLGDAEGPVDLTLFLGHQLVVGRTVVSVMPNNPLAPANDPTIRTLNLYPPTLDGLVVGVAEDQTLDSARTGAERDIFTDNGVTIDVLPTIYSPRQFHKVESFVENSPYLTHFNCHATPEQPRAGLPCALRVTESYHIPRTSVDALPLCEESIIVLNCCNGHTLEHSARDTLAVAFAQRGVAAVVASTERLVDDHATLWARHFYKRMFAGEAVGPALLAARREVIAITKNPACLVYGFLGCHSAKLVDVPEARAA